MFFASARLQKHSSANLIELNFLRLCRFKIMDVYTFLYFLTKFGSFI